MTLISFIGGGRGRWEGLLRSSFFDISFQISHFFYLVFIEMSIIYNNVIDKFQIVSSLVSENNFSFEFIDVYGLDLNHSPVHVMENLYRTIFVHLLKRYSESLPGFWLYEYLVVSVIEIRNLNLYISCLVFNLSIYSRICMGCSYIGSEYYCVALHGIDSYGHIFLVGQMDSSSSYVQTFSYSSQSILSVRYNGTRD